MRHGVLGSLLVCLLATSGMVIANGLQVVPTSLSLQPSQNADGLWLSNTGDSVVHAQIRVYHWTQDGQGDQLASSRGLVVSPPMLQLAVGDRQLIRVIRIGAPPTGAGAMEDAYRLSVDELPIDAQGKQGLQFVLHYSLPIFIEPAGSAAAPPQLQWHLLRDGEHVVLQVTNHGGSHAQLARLSYVDATGHRTDITQGLLGYVLPGATMHWTLKPPATVFAAGGTLEAMINGEKASQNLSLADNAR
jgi:fimbrial chaperone protein